MEWDIFLSKNLPLCKCNYPFYSAYNSLNHQVNFGQFELCTDIEKNPGPSVFVDSTKKNRPFALRGHVTSCLWKWKLYDFAFEKRSVGHILNKIIVIWFFKPAPFLKMSKFVARHVTKLWFLKLGITSFRTQTLHLKFKGNVEKMMW